MANQLDELMESGLRWANSTPPTTQPIAHGVPAVNTSGDCIVLNVHLDARVLLFAAGDAYEAYVAHLPGVVSQGGSREEALAGIKEALDAALEAYFERGEEVPWSDTQVVIEAEQVEEEWIRVDG